MKRKVIACFCAAAMFATCAVPAMAESSGQAAAVLHYADASENVMTRGSFVQMLAEASGEQMPEFTGNTTPFKEIAGNQYINWAYAKWIINGDSNSSFRINDAVTRQEAAAMLSRYLDYRYPDLPAAGPGGFINSNIAGWAVADVTKCCSYSIIPLDSSADFRPYDTVSSAELAQWLENIKNLNVTAVAPGPALTFSASLTEKLNAEGNWDISPYSIRMCLAMLANGAKGDTQAEILKALQIDDINEYNAETKKLLEQYEGYARIMSLETANSMWLNQTTFNGKGSFLPDFSKKMADVFGAASEEVTNSNSVEKVNAWVNEKTKGKIPTILTDENRDFATALVNAVYFKAAWKDEFDASMTKEADFTNADGSKSKLDFMNRTDHMGYYSTAGIQAVKCDYRNYAADNEMGDNYEFFRDADFSMYFIKALDESTDVENFLNTAKFNSVPVKLSLPKFKVEYGASLDDALKALGVNTAYDANAADLSAMIDPSTAPGGKHYLDTVLHKTYLAIDEKGTEAAAVTAAMMEAGSAFEEREPVIREFTADSPFFFAIRDNASGELLFVGRYETAK